MATHGIRPGIIDELWAYPLIVTGQLVLPDEQPAPRSATTPVDGTARATPRRPSARFHHTSRFGVPR